MKNAKVLSYLFSLVFFAIWLGIFFGNRDNMPRYNLLWTRGFFFAIILLIILLAIVKMKFKNIINKKFIYIGLFLLIFVGQCFLLFNLYQKIGWDVDVVLDYAYKIANQPLDKIDLTHLEIYPNLSLMITVYSFIFKIFSFLSINGQYYLFALISILCVDLSLVLIYKICNHIFNRRIALTSVILFTAFFAFSPWIMVPYSDTLSMPFPLIIFYLHIKSNEVSKGKQLGIYALMGIITAIGYLIKPQVIIVCIAIIMVMAFRVAIQYKKYRRNILYIFILLVVLLSFSKLYSVTINKVYDHRIINEKNISFTHYLMMGLNERKGLYGAWNEEDFNYSMSFPTKHERQEANLHIVEMRLKEFGVAGYSNFIWKKVNWIMGDATFFWMCEGAGFTKDLSYNGTNIQRYLRDFFYLDAPNFKVYGTYVTGIYLAILLFMLIPYQEKKSIDYLAMIKLSIVGIVMFTLLFEGRSRYLINYIPFLIMAASTGIYQFQTFVNRLRITDKVRS